VNEPIIPYSPPRDYLYLFSLALFQCSFELILWLFLLDSIGFYSYTYNEGRLLLISNVGFIGTKYVFVSSADPILSLFQSASSSYYSLSFSSLMSKSSLICYIDGIIGIIGWLKSNFDLLFCLGMISLFIYLSFISTDKPLLKKLFKVL